jgi:hypothetical protein
MNNPVRTACLLLAVNFQGRELAKYFYGSNRSGNVCQRGSRATRSIGGIDLRKKMLYVMNKQGGYINISSIENTLNFIHITQILLVSSHTTESLLRISDSLDKVA